MRALIAGVLLAPISAFAQSIFFDFTDGATLSYEVAEVRRTDFNGSELRLFLWDGSTFAWDMSEIRRYRFNDISTGVDGGDTPLNPIRIFPNPSNGVVTIGFELDRTGEVIFEVFDLKGTLVERIATLQLASGAHSITWNGTGPRGEQVANGTYVCRITQGTQHASEPLIIER